MSRLLTIPMLVAIVFAAAAGPAPAAAAPADGYVPGSCIDNDGIGSDPFTDVAAGAFHHDAVEWAFHNRIVSGFDADTFAPDAPVSRAEFAAMLHRMACLPAPTGSADFGDVPPGAFFADAVDWMVGERITLGLDDERFGPYDPMTRGQFAAFLWRYVGEPGGSPVAAFVDVDRAEFFALAIDWLLHRSVTSGTTPVTFSPWSLVTRGEVVAFLHRLNTIGDVQLAFDQVVSGLAAPIAAAHDPTDGAVFVAERGGRVYRFDADPGRRPDWSTGRHVLTVDVSQSGEGGLLGVAVEPDGSALYVSFTNGAGDSVVRRHAMSGGVPQSTGVDTIGVDQPRSNHNGGHIVFGPDGHLFASFGDGGGSNDPDGNGQDNSVLLGKILRLDPLPAGGYDTPPDNPLSGPTGREEIWANGVRNPWRFSFDRETGDLWVADVGQDAREEITRLRAADVPTAAGGWGANLGWRLREGDIATPGVGGAAPPGHVGPVHVYGGHSSGCVSITGGFVYRGDDIPALWGSYVYGDYCATSRLSGWRDVAGVEAETFSATVPGGNLVSFFEDATGELYTISLNGTIARLTRG